MTQTKVNSFVISDWDQLEASKRRRDNKQIESRNHKEYLGWKDPAIYVTDGETESIHNIRVQHGAGI